MGYRDSDEASHARIEALEHEVNVLRAAAEARAHEDEARSSPPSAPTVRERELTRELETARRAIATLSGREPSAPRPASGLGVVAAAVVALTGLALAFSFARPGTAPPRSSVPASTVSAPPVAAVDVSLVVAEITGSTGAASIGDGDRCALYVDDGDRGACRASVWCEGFELVPTEACERDASGITGDGFEYDAAAATTIVTLPHGRVVMRASSSG